MIPAIANLIVALGAECALLGAASTRRPLCGVPLMLDLWVAAGLLRLSHAASWATIGGVAALVAVRKLVMYSLSRRAVQGIHTS